MREPEKVKPFLEPAMFKLYQLIWQRFVASQMEAAVYDTLQVEVTGRTAGHEYLLRASGSAVKFLGFHIVYQEAKNEDVKSEEDEEENVRIPAGIEEGQKQNLVRLIPEQHFTQPPPRYSEASLVATLEENGIGRPSTYAPTISTIQQRGYVERVDKRLIPTETGILVNDLMIQYFPDIVDYQFTARMEEDLDKIAEGQDSWVHVMQEFWTPFSADLVKAQAEMPVTKSGPEPIGRACPDVRQGTRHPLRALRKIHLVFGLPRMPLHRAVAGKDRRDLPERWRRCGGAQDAQRPRLLRLYELPQLRFHFVEEANNATVSQMQRPACDRE